MATKKKMVIAVFRDTARAENAHEWLQSRGYTPDEISVMTSVSTKLSYLADAGKDLPIRAGNAAAEGLSVGGAIGTAVGATLGAVLAIGTSVVIPGLGVVVAGPMAAAFAGAGAGAVTGGAIGALAGLNIEEPNVQAYQQALRAGGVILGVVPHNEEEVYEMEQYFENHHGENVCYC
jgi:hypothetical protein